MKAMLVAVPLLLVGGVVAAGLAGVIDVPGLTPKKAAKKANLYTEATEPPVASIQPPQKPAAQAVKPPSKPSLDLALGAKRLAKLWNLLPPEKLLALTLKWREFELAAVVAAMQSDKAAALLALMPPERASAISRQIQEEAARGQRAAGS